MKNIKIILISVLLSSVVSTSSVFLFSNMILFNKDKNESSNVVNSIVEYNNEDNIPNVISRVSDAVVSVIISKDIPKIEKYYRNFDNPFGINFSIPQYKQNGIQSVEIGGGTAFFVSSDGMLITNNHVISEENAEYTVLYKDEKLKATVLEKDIDNDLALLKVDGDNFPVLTLGDSDAIKLGQKVIAIGNALSEFNNTVSVGVVSGLSRSIVAGDLGLNSSEKLSRLIQTDAAINPGNSGGPLLDTSGNVIGINVAIVQNAQNIGFSVPVKVAKNLLDSYIKYGRLIKPFIGISYSVVEKDVKNIKEGYAYILDIIENSPANLSGIKSGDVITHIDGKELSKDFSVYDALQDKKIGDILVFEILRDNKKIELEVKLGEK